jgi:hypothetical protein
MKPAAPAPSRFFQPKVENLEERWLLSTFRPAVSSYADDLSGRLGLFAFATGQDGHLYDAYYFPNQGGWLWQDQGIPPSGASIVSDPAVGTYYDIQGREGLLAFADGSDGHLYEVSHFPEFGTWYWADLGKPASGAGLVSTPAVADYLDGTGRSGVFAFATGSDGHLYDTYYFPDQNGWLWQDQGTPQGGATLISAPATLNVAEYSTRPGLFAFATGSDGHLYDVYYFPDQNGWLWQDQGTPPGGARLWSDPGTDYYVDPSGRVGLFAFATGSDGALYDVYYFADQGRWLWQSQGIPPSGASVISDPAVGRYTDPAGRPGLFAFATGSDGVLYDVYYFPNQGGWLWQSQDRPPSGTVIVSDPAVGYYIDEYTGATGFFSFVRGADNHLYDVYFFPNQGGWLWQDQGMPNPGFGPHTGPYQYQPDSITSATPSQPGNLATTSWPDLDSLTDRALTDVATSAREIATSPDGTVLFDVPLVAPDYIPQRRSDAWALAESWVWQCL